MIKVFIYLFFIGTACLSQTVSDSNGDYRIAVTLDSTFQNSANFKIDIYNNFGFGSYSKLIFGDSASSDSQIIDIEYHDDLVDKSVYKEISNLTENKAYFVRGYFISKTYANGSFDVLAYTNKLYFRTKNVAPYIVSTSISTNNKTISVTMNEEVFNSSAGSGALEASDFSLNISGGNATLLSSTPSSISSSGKNFKLGINLSGIPNGSEILSVNPVNDGIYDLIGNEASISQNNNTVNLNKNSPPVLALVSDIIIVEDSSYSTLLVANDLNGDIINFSAKSDVSDVIVNIPDDGLYASTISSSLSFDGIDDYAITSVNSSSFFTQDSSYTLELWYKTKNGTHKEDQIMLLGTYDRSNEGGATNGVTHLTIDPSNYGENGKVKFVKGGNNGFSIHSSSRIDDNEWHHIAGVYNLKTSKVSIYNKLQFALTTNVRVVCPLVLITQLYFEI